MSLFSKAAIKATDFFHAARTPHMYSPYALQNEGGMTNKAKQIGHWLLSASDSCVSYSKETVVVTSATPNTNDGKILAYRIEKAPYGLLKIIAAVVLVVTIYWKKSRTVALAVLLTLLGGKALHRIPLLRKSLDIANARALYQKLSTLNTPNAMEEAIFFSENTGNKIPTKPAGPIQSEGVQLLTEGVQLLIKHVLDVKNNGTFQAFLASDLLKQFLDCSDVEGGNLNFLTIYEGVNGERKLTSSECIELLIKLSEISGVKIPLDYMPPPFRGSPSGLMPFFISYIKEVLNALENSGRSVEDILDEKVGAFLSRIDMGNKWQPMQQFYTHFADLQQYSPRGSFSYSNENFYGKNDKLIPDHQALEVAIYFSKKTGVKIPFYKASTGDAAPFGVGVDILYTFIQIQKQKFDCLDTFINAPISDEGILNMPEIVAVNEKLASNFSLIAEFFGCIDSENKKSYVPLFQPVLHKQAKLLETPLNENRDEEQEVVFGDFASSPEVKRSFSNISMQNYELTANDLITPVAVPRKCLSKAALERSYWEQMCIENWANRILPYFENPIISKADDSKQQFFLLEGACEIIENLLWKCPEQSQTLQCKFNGFQELLNQIDLESLGNLHAGYLHNHLLDLYRRFTKIVKSEAFQNPSTAQSNEKDTLLETSIPQLLNACADLPALLSHLNGDNIVMNILLIRCLENTISDWKKHYASVIDSVGEDLKNQLTLMSDVLNKALESVKEYKEEQKELLHLDSAQVSPVNNFADFGFGSPEKNNSWDESS